MNLNILQWRSLKTRVTVITLAIFVISIWALTFYAGRMLREDMQRLLGDQQFSTVSLIAAGVNQDLNDRLRALEKISEKIGPAIPGNTAALQELLEQRTIFQTLFNGGTFVTRLDGTVIADVPLSTGRLGLNYIDRDHIAAALKEGKTTIGRPYTGRTLRAPIVGMAVPIRDPHGKVIGALVGVIDLGKPGFLDKIMEGHYGKTGGYLVIDAQHARIITASDKSRILEALPPPGINPSIDRFTQGYEGSQVYVNPLGVEQLASAKNIPVSAWHIVAVLPTAEAFAPIHDMQRRMLLATIFLTLLASCLTWWMLRRQLSPMLAAVKTLATLSDTNQHPQPLPITRQDEIGELIGGFNRLLETLGQRKEALRESEEKYRSLASTADSMYLVDRDCRFLLVNERHLARFGLPAEQVRGRKHGEFHSVEDAVVFENHVKHVFETGESHQDEYRSARDGRYFVRTLSPVKDNNGTTSSVTVVAKDITEHKLAEEENRSLQERLNRSEKMESLGTLAGGVAHDLNNVLGVVVGYSEILLDGVDKSSPLRHGLENVMSGGLKAAAIVDDLLTLARRGVPGRSILNLNKIIADCQKSPEFANLSFHHPSVKIKTDLDPDLPNISGSSVHLVKSLFNLVSNASEAMAKGGLVTITTSNLYLDKPIHGYDQIRTGDYVVLSVSDTGEGIHEADLKRIFEPFYTKKVMGRSGTGLGLAVVWGTVKDHSGYVNVQSEEGKGSTFTLYFPVTREDISVEAAAVAISEYTGNGESILVVDDVKEQRDLAAGMLRTLNYNVSSVSSGEDAVAYLKEHEVDLMVLDMIMDPGMDGLDTYKKILEIYPQQKAIIVSGFSESDRVKTAEGLGAGAYVRKPYIKEKLGLAVRKELDRKR